MSNFDKALTFTLQWEGGYVNDPKDPGGETKFGISKKAFPSLDIKNLTKEKAAEIYQQQYWIPCGCDKMDLGMSIAVFDTAVNCGVARAKKWASVANSYVGVLEERKDHYDQIIAKNKNLLKFRKGWLNRVTSLEKYINQACSN